MTLNDTDHTGETATRRLPRFFRKMGKNFIILIM